MTVTQPMTVAALAHRIHAARHLRLLDREDVPDRPARLIMHPRTWAEVRSDTVGWRYEPFSDKPAVMGVEITASLDIPEGKVIIVWQEDET